MSSMNLLANRVSSGICLRVAHCACPPSCPSAIPFARMAMPLFADDRLAFFKRLVEFQTPVLGGAAPGKRNFCDISQFSLGISLSDQFRPAAAILRPPSG